MARITPGSLTQGAFVRARRTLREWLRLFPDCFFEVFVERRICHSVGLDTQPLIDLGLLQESSGFVSAPVCCYPYSGLFLLCDRPTSSRLDRIFPIFPDESLFLADWAIGHRSGTVVDLGTGSGVLALLAAQRGASKVFATDVSWRVEKHFALTARLNGLESKVEYITSDVFSGLGNERFDTVLSNPPFVPVPNRHQYYLHSNGGPFGTSVIERILEDIADRLKPGGCLYFLALSLGNQHSWRVGRLVRETQQNGSYSRRTLEGSIYPLYQGERLSLRQLSQKFSHASAFSQWEALLAENGYEEVGYFAAHLQLSPGQMKVSHPMNNLQSNQPSNAIWNEYCGSMSKRLRRY